MVESTGPDPVQARTETLPLADAPRPLRQVHRRRGEGLSRHGRLRLIFFSVASIWGFLIGTAAVLGALIIQDPGFSIAPTLAAALAVAALVALAGGLVAARVYRHRVAPRRR